MFYALFMPSAMEAIRQAEAARKAPPQAVPDISCCDYPDTKHPNFPLGLRPRYIVVEQRIAEIAQAIERYAKAGVPTPAEWMDELADLNIYLRNRSKANGPHQD